MVKSMPKLKIVACISAGYDHIGIASLSTEKKTIINIDVQMLKRNNIRVSNTPNVVNDATAEQAMALMLGAARNTVLG